MAGKLRDFIPMYGGGPIGGPRPDTPANHPGAYQSAEQRQAIHPCGGYPYSMYHVSVETASTLYRYGRGNEVMTEEQMASSPWFFKGDFSRIPQKMIQFLNQVRHPVDVECSTLAGDGSFSNDIEDQVRFRLQMRDGSLEENPPGADGGIIPAWEEPDPDEIAEAKWDFNNQHRSWDENGVPWNSSQTADSYDFENGHRHPSWAWRLLAMNDSDARRRFGGRGSENTASLFSGFIIDYDETYNEGSETEGQQAAGSYYSEAFEMDVPVFTEWIEDTGGLRGELDFTVRPKFIYLSEFGYWIFDLFYSCTGTESNDVYFGNSAWFIVDLQASFGDFELAQLHLDNCQDIADSFYGSNPTKVYYPLPVNDFDAKPYQYGPDPEDDSVWTYFADTGLIAPGYALVSVSSSDPRVIIQGTFDVSFDWSRVLHGTTPAQDAPADGNRKNFGDFYTNAPST